MVKDSRGEKEINAMMMPDLKVGDWILYASNIAVHKVSEDDAKEILELLEPKKPHRPLVAG